MHNSGENKASTAEEAEGVIKENDSNVEFANSETSTRYNLSHVMSFTPKNVVFIFCIIFHNQFCF